MKNTALQSGTLELYALGALSADERAAAGQVLANNPDARQELQNIEADLEQFAAIQSRNPSPAVRARVMSGIGAKIETEVPQKAAPAPTRFLSPATLALTGITCIAVLSTITLSYRWNEERANSEALRRENDKLAAMIDAETAKRRSGDDLLGTLKATDMATFKAVAANGEVKGQLYWNRSTRQAVFVSLVPTGQLIAYISDSGNESQVNVMPSDNLPQFYQFSLPESAESLRLANTVNTPNQLGEVSVILRQKKITTKRVPLDEPSLPKTGM